MGTLLAVILAIFLTSLFWIYGAGKAVKKWKAIALENERDNIRRRRIMNQCSRCIREYRLREAAPEADL